MQNVEQGTLIPEEILWVKDSPLVIDDDNIARFYDAIIRPTYKESAPRTIRLSESQRKELQNSVGGTLKGGISGLFGLFSAEAELNAGLQTTSGSDTGSEQEIVLEPISSSQRQLEQLIIYYSLEYPARLLVGQAPALLHWHETGFAAKLPRALCLVDLPPGTRFIPIAAEFENGVVATLFKDVAAKANKELPQYNRQTKADYWRSLSEMADPTTAAAVIEAASVAHGKIEWIDFRILVNDEGRTAHLHLESRQRFFTGAFAYMVVRRAEGHGVRLVGTLKDGPDLNVLAIYEK